MGWFLIGDSGLAFSDTVGGPGSRTVDIFPIVISLEDALSGEHGLICWEHTFSFRLTTASLD